jgi:hypothetical protein
MKKGTTVFGALLLTVSIFTSCGGSLESDAKKFAEIQCKAKKLAEKGVADASVLEESAKLAQELESLGNELKGKYTTTEDLQKLEAAIIKESVNCN